MNEDGRGQLSSWKWSGTKLAHSCNNNDNNCITSNGYPLKADCRLSCGRGGICGGVPNVFVVEQHIRRVWAGRWSKWMRITATVTTTIDVVAGTFNRRNDVVVCHCLLSILCLHCNKNSSWRSIMGSWSVLTFPLLNIIGNQKNCVTKWFDVLFGDKRGEVRSRVNHAGE